MMKTKEMAVLGVLTGLAILLSYVFAIQTPFVRITFGFLPIALAGAWYGPWKGGLVAALCDFIGSTCLGAGMFFPGFLLSNFLAGFIYGYFLHKKEITFASVCIPFILVALLIHLGLNTLWLALYYDKAAGAIFMSRLIKNMICLPLEIGLFVMIHKQVAPLFSSGKRN